MSKILTRSTLILILSTVLSACGFSLRGSDTLSSQLDKLLLISQQPNSEFSRLLQRSLTISNVDVETVTTAEAEAIASSIPVLAIGSEQILSRPVSVNSRARAAQYELRLSIDIALGNIDEYLIAPEILFVERSYFEDIENIGGNREEIEIITAEMRRELVNQLMRRLESTNF